MRKIIYRNQLLQAVELFLEGTPAASLRAQRIIRRCSVSIQSKEKCNTLDYMIWSSYFHVLMSATYYEDTEFLQDTRKILLGQSPHHTIRMAWNVDSRRYFTADDTTWYTLLVSMVDLLMTVPFVMIYQATAHVRKNIKDWKTTYARMPEATRMQKVEEEYQHKKDLINEIAVRHPLPEDSGDEKIHRLVLREITSVLTTINIGISALYLGYPVLSTCHSTSIDITKIDEYPDMTDHLTWAKKILESLTGKGTFFISWRLSKAHTFNAAMLLVTLY